MIKLSNGNKWLAIVLGVSMLSACSLMPGSHIKHGKSNSWFYDDKDQEKAEQEDLSDNVRIHPIQGNKTPPKVHEVSPDLADNLNKEAEYYDYQVGSGDVLNITVWDHPELTIPAGGERSAKEAGNWVHSDGTIFYPYVGKIKVEGLSVAQIRDKLTKALDKYIESPQVDVTVASFKSQRVYVSGSVNEPGTYPVTNVPMRLLDAVNTAGGVSEEGDWRNVVLTRDGKDYKLSLKEVYEKGDKRFNILLRSDDVVHVGRGDDNKVFVLGEVNEPNALSMGRNGLTLAEALAESGGINELQADASGIFVMRRTIEDEERFVDVYQLDAKNAVSFILADEFELTERDIVYVTAAPAARWNRVVSNIMPTVQAIYYGARAASESQKID